MTETGRARAVRRSFHKRLKQARGQVKWPITPVKVQMDVFVFEGVLLARDGTNSW